MAYFKITTNKKGVLSAKIQAYGIDFATKKRKVQYKRIVNDEGLSRAKFTKFVEREAIAFEESLAELYQFSSVTQSCLTLCDPMDCSTLGFDVHHQLSELAQTHAIQPSHLCRPLLLLPSIFPSIQVFSNESTLHIRWPKCWSFSFSISPSSEYFRTDFL